MKGSQGENAEDLRGLSASNHSDQMVLGTVRREAGPRERLPKAPKTKLAQVGPSGSSPLRSDGSCDCQGGGWTVLMMAEDTQRES